jgi:hypothetical protein
LRSIWFNTPQLAAVTGGVGDLFPHKGKDFKVKSLIPRSLLLGSSFVFQKLIEASGFETFVLYKYKVDEEKNLKYNI